MSLQCCSFIMLLLCCLTGAQPPPNFTKCHQLPTAKTNYSDIIANSPFYVYRSSSDIFNCSTGIGTGPKDEEPLIQGIFMIVKGAQVLMSFSVLNIDNFTATQAVSCFNGVKLVYRFLAFNFTLDNTYACPYICSDDGVTLETFRCYGRNANDEANIQKAIDYYMPNIPGAEKIVNTMKDCPPQSFCPFFY